MSVQYCESAEFFRKFYNKKQSAVAHIKEIGWITILSKSKWIGYVDDDETFIQECLRWDLGIRLSGLGVQDLNLVMWIGIEFVADD